MYSVYLKWFATDPTIIYWAAIIQVLQYFQRTKNIALKLGEDSMDEF
jgi:hypothetical protein